jgi:AcrR family transcriptional regulator
VATRGVKRPEETRAQITRAAAEALAEHGYDGVRVQDVARRAGLTTGAIYTHFRGRAELIAAAVESRASSVLMAELEPAAERRTAPARLIDLAIRVFADPGGATNPLEIEALVAARREPELANLLGERLNLLHDQFAERIAVAQKNGQLDPDVDPHAIIYFCHALLLGLVLLDNAADHRPSDEDWTRLIRRLVRRLA